MSGETADIVDRRNCGKIKNPEIEGQVDFICEGYCEVCVQPF